MTSQSFASNLDQLTEELNLQETLLSSLHGQPGTDDKREDIEEYIARLRQKISKLDQQQLPNWGSAYPNNSRTHRSPSKLGGSPYSTESTSLHDPFVANPTSPTMILPNRKRPRNDYDDDFDTLNVPGPKALRTPTPRTASPARSVNSIGTDFSDDPLLRKLLGDDYIDDKKSTEKYLKELETKRLQEEADAEFARQLQDKWNDDLSAANKASKSFDPSSSYSQSLLRSDGSSFQKAVPIKPVSIPDSGRPDVPHPPTTSGVSTPSSDDSALVEISSTDWTRQFGASQPRSLPWVTPTMNNNMRMPGAFPSLKNPYSSTPGSSVYGNSPLSMSQYNSSTSSLNNTYNNLGRSMQPNGGLPGTSRMPFDLDNYPLPSSLSFADPDQAQEDIKDLLKHIRPDEELTPQQLAEIQPEGLKINLMPHQRKGYAWMKSMEEGTNKGGILADDMGLGKTIQSLALILGRPPPLDDDGRRPQRPTLIVAPVALMQQWERETKKMIHRSHRLNVLILHGNNRNSSWNDIKNYDIVLTTYGLLASDLKRKDAWDKYLKLVPDARPNPSQQTPVMGEKSKFYRVILDEAQNIKNKSTKGAIAACRIQADHRWCLSGTPMQNNVDEIFSLIKFCRIRPYNDYDKFSREIGRPLKSRQMYYSKDKAMQQLQALLRACLLRRTKKSEIDGQPIIQLPTKHTIEERAVFNKDDLDFYKSLEKKAQIQFNKYLKNGTVGRNYSHALVLLLRLRQCCCSPQLVTNANDFLVNALLQDLDYVQNAKLLPKEVVKRLSDLEAVECPICMDAVENPIIFNPCGHSLCQECLSTMVDKALADGDSHKVNCPHCRAEIDTNKVTDHESFLRVHFPDRPGVKPLDDNDGDQNGSDETDAESSSDDDIEDDDDDDGADLKDFIVPDEADVENDTDEGESSKEEHIEKTEDDENVKDFQKVQSKSRLKEKKKSKAKDKKGKGKNKKAKSDIKTLAQLRAEGLRSRAAKKKYIRRLGRGFQASTKIEKTLQLLKDIREKGEGEKTIIFSSFTSFLDLLEVAMNRDEDDLSKYTRYDGSMSAKDRNDAVIQFTDDPNCKAILVSLKAGNSGLNLTVANHVLILDPFWNPFVEHQAADRCYRIGQTREVTVHRVLIGEGDEHGNLLDKPEGSEREFTVEDRILALQEKKRLLVETALDETASGNIGRLGVRELGYLFGVNSMG